ncbi:uncharacterized protein METZ01_LOCUS464292, partial [marine metagenome]
MKKCGIYNDLDGNVKVVHPTDKSISDSDLKALVQKQLVVELIQKTFGSRAAAYAMTLEDTPEELVDCKVVDEEALPNRTF